jgi:hypothetical protein
MVKNWLFKGLLTGMAKFGFRLGVAESHFFLFTMYELRLMNITR